MRTTNWCAVVICLLAWAVPSAAQEGFGRLEQDMPETGCGFPEFSLLDPGGRAVTLSEHKGTVVLLSFCACYVDSCSAMMRALEDLYAEFGRDRITAIIVCSEVSPALTQEGFAGLVEKCGKGHTVLLDADRAMKARFKVRKLPTTFLLDRNLCVYSRVIDLAALHSDEFRSQVRALIEKP